MGKAIDITVLKIEGDILESIIKQAEETLTNATLHIVTYKKFDKSVDGKADFELESKISTTSGDCVYALYTADENGKFNVKYIGSSNNLTYRLNKHLVKNDDAFLDGTYEKKKNPYHSKISNVYKELQGKNVKQIAFRYFKVENNHIYTAIESLLIEYYNLIKDGWNERN